jgi:hypothetical protein
MRNGGLELESTEMKLKFNDKEGVSDIHILFLCLFISLCNFDDILNHPNSPRVTYKCTR